MIKYYTTTEGKNFLKIDDEILNGTMLFIKNDLKFKSDLKLNDSYQNLLNEIIKTDSPWIHLDESIFNDKLSQFI
jgi:hypothetical protein